MIGCLEIFQTAHYIYQANTGLKLQLENRQIAPDIYRMGAQIYKNIYLKNLGY